MKPGVFQGKKFPFTPKRRKKSLGSQCNNIIDTRHDLAAFRSKLANVSWLSSYIQLLLVEVIDIVPNMCLPTSLGLRDMVTTVKRLSSRDTVLAWERDMEDMFWKIDKQEVETAISQLGRTLLKHRRSTTLFYAIHR